MKIASRFSRIMPVLAVAVIALPLIASAAGTAQDIVTPIASQVLSLVKILVTVVFVLAVVAFGWGIVQFIFAGGDPASLGKAKSFLLWGVIGMAVMASVFGLIDFMQRYFGVSNSALVINQPTVQ